jgi:L-lactate dehydrogenase complex protein LldG
MSDSKEKVLSRIRTALGRANKDEARAFDAAEMKRDYQQKSELGREEILKLFAERVSEYRAVTEQLREDKLAERISRICEKEEIKKLVIPPGLEDGWTEKLSGSVTSLQDELSPLSKEELNAADAVLTNCILGVAQTGTIILDAGPGQGRRALTLLPDFHICVVREEQVVGIIPEAIRKLDEIVRNTGRPVTFISGPSATSDIELNRVEGVHGPRKLHVLIVSKPRGQT